MTSKTIRMPLMLPRDLEHALPHIITMEVSPRTQRRSYANHQQSLELLAHRGGLCPTEALAIVEDREWTLLTIKEIVRRFCENGWLEVHDEFED